MFKLVIINNRERTLFVGEEDPFELRSTNQNYVMAADIKVPMVFYFLLYSILLCSIKT